MFALVAAFALSVVNPGAATSVEVEAPGPNGALRGTMLSPAATDAATPLVIIIPGSGPTDRDGNNPLGVRAASYRLLAEALAARGVASVRIDKRGMFGSAAAGDPNGATIAGYAADVGSWVSTLRTRTGARCVWLAGHSEGALVALAAREDTGVCGLILIAGAGRPLGQVMREQLRANPANAPILDQALAALDEIEARRPVDVAGLHPALRGLFAPQVQTYLMDLLSHDPVAMLRGYARPVLILHGARDIQVAEADARALAAADPDARLVVLPGVNHVLKDVAGDDRAANMATYANPDLPLADGVAEAIVGFVRR